MDIKDDYEETASIDSQGKRKSFRRVIVRFAEKTSMQGVPYINSAKLQGARIAWAILLFLAIVAMTLHLYYLCDQFFSWPKTTKISLGFDNLEMPAVTICNVNTVKRTKLSTMSQQFQNLVGSVDPSNVNIPGTGRKKRVATDFNNLNFSAYEEEIDDPTAVNRPPKNKLQQIESTFRSLYMDHQRHLRTDGGHKLDDMLLSCSFDGRDCYPMNFTLYQTADYGNCYTLQAKDFIVRSSGPENGLVMILYMENEEYLSGITQGYGSRVTIHPPDTYPFPSIEGTYASTAFETTIAMKLVNITRLEKPYGNCSYGVDFKAKYKRNYTRQACLTVCSEERLIEKCGCFNEDNSEIFKVADKTLYHPCRNIEERTCMTEVNNEFRSKFTTCQCFDPCYEVAYEKTISSRQWPTYEYSRVLHKSICDKPGKSASCTLLGTLDSRRLSLNFLKLVIYYESLNYESVEENPEIEPAQFASDVGGALGLWIGLSILSIFELVQLCVECCDYGCSRRKKHEAAEQRREMERQKRRYNDAYGGSRYNNGYYHGGRAQGSPDREYDSIDHSDKWRNGLNRRGETDKPAYTVYTGSNFSSR